MRGRDDVAAPVEDTGHVGFDGRALCAVQLAGYLDEGIISGADLSNVAFRIQYIPGVETPREDEDARPPAPTAIAATPGERINTVRVTPGGPLGPTDSVELFASIDNNRANAVRVAWGSVTEFTHDLPPGATRYYWALIRRVLQGPDVLSNWFPASATAGIRCTTLHAPSALFLGPGGMVT